jgi:Domain of unknown function (DUF4911)
MTDASQARLEKGEGTSFMDTRCVLVRVERHDIGLLCSLMAGYEGVAIVRTVDPKQGLVALLVAPAFYMTVLDIIQALSQEMSLCLLMTEGGDMPESVMPGAGSHPVGRDMRD